MHMDTPAGADSASGDLDAGYTVLAALCVATFLASLNFYAMTPFYLEIADDLDTTVPLLGQIATLMIFISAGLGLAVGPLADRYGYRKPLVFGVLAVAITLAGTGMAPSYPVLLLVSITGGLADALVFSLPLAIAGVRFSGRARNRAISWTLGSLSCAPIVGVPILTSIGDLGSWRTALLAAGAASAASAWFVARALPADAEHPESRFDRRQLVAAYQPLLRHPQTLRLYGSSALRSITWIGLITYLGAYLGDELGLSTREAGLIYTVGGFGSALGSVLGGHLPFRSPRSAVGVGCIVCAATGAAMLLIHNVWLVVPLLFLVTSSAAVTGNAIVTLLAAESPAKSGTTMVLNGSVLNLGAAAGASLGGLLLATGGYDALGYGLPLFAVAAGLLAWWPVAGASA